MVVTLYVPILTPRKGVAVDLSCVEATSGVSARVATETERTDVSAALLWHRLMSTYFIPQYLLDVPDEGFDRRVDYLMEKLLTLEALIALPIVEADRLLKENFPGYSDSDFSLSGLVEAIPEASAVVPTDHNRLFLLSQLLAEKSIQFIVLRGHLSERVQFRYRIRENYHQRARNTLPSRAAQWIGRIVNVVPTTLRIPALMARRTQFYRIKFIAPSGSFVAQMFFSKIEDDGPPASPLRPIDCRGRATLRSSPGVGESQIEGSNLRDLDELIDVIVSCPELPPGSTGYAVLVGFILLLSMWISQVMLVNSIASSAVDPAAFVIALTATAPTATAAFLPRQSFYLTPALTRFSLVGMGVMGNNYALWILARNSSSTTEGLLRWIFDNYARFGNWLSMASVLGLMIALVVRSVRISALREQV